MQKLSAIIVDDEEKAQRLTENLLKETGKVEVLDKADGVDPAFELIKKHKPDVIFLDVEMPMKNGFELVKILQQTNYKPEIVFVTAYDKYAIEAFKYAAFNFLLKPIDKDDLQQTIERLLEKKDTINYNEKLCNLIDYLEPKNRIKLNTRTGYILIDPLEIVFCKADGSYTEIHQTNGQNAVSTYNLGQIEPLLPSREFFRISRSIIIKLSFLKEVNRKTKTCSTYFDGKEKVFDIPRKQLKELEKTI